MLKLIEDTLHRCRGFLKKFSVEKGLEWNNKLTEHYCKEHKFREILHRSSPLASNRYSRTEFQLTSFPIRNWRSLRIALGFSNVSLSDVAEIGAGYELDSRVLYGLRTSTRFMYCHNFIYVRSSMSGL